MVLIDTCAIIEWVKEKRSFSNETVKKVERGAYILSISFAELACLVKSGRLEMNLSVQDLYIEYSGIKAINIVNIGVEEWLDSIHLEWAENKDPADRLIVAFARKHHLPIVTTDRSIKKFYKEVVW